MNKKCKGVWVVLALLCLVGTMRVFAGGEKESETVKKEAESAEPEKAQPFDIAVFVPGVVAGSAIYEKLAEGAQAVGEKHDNVRVKILEAGFNQGEWQEKMTSLAATGEYEVIISSNPSIPFIALEVLKEIPDQNFIIMDAYLEGHPKLFTLLYNQMEQAYLNGYMAGLVTTSEMEGANKDLKVGMIVAQEYPALTKMMKAGYVKGFKAVNENIELDYRIIGNWYDANKAADLAASMFDAGVDVVFAIAGGAGQGVIKAAEKYGKYVVWWESNEYALAPGVIVGCTVNAQKRAVEEVLTRAVKGELPYGSAQIGHAEEGYVDFILDDPLYKQHVPEKVRLKMAEIVEKIRSGQLSLPVPEDIKSKL